MSDRHQIIVKDATISGHVAGELTLTGYIVSCEPESPVKRDVLRPVAPDEPDTDVEVGYSQDALEPLTVVYRGRKAELTKTLYILFRYVNDLYRAEGQTEFDFAELSEVLTCDECALSSNAIGKYIRCIAHALAKIVAPITLSYYKEVLYIENLAADEEPAIAMPYKEPKPDSFTSSIKQMDVVDTQSAVLRALGSTP